MTDLLDKLQHATETNRTLTRALQDAHQEFVKIRVGQMHWKESQIVAARALEAIQTAFMVVEAHRSKAEIDEEPIWGSAALAEDR